MKKYILTGGPGSGKSSIILALEQLGEYTVREAAEDYIRLRQSQGITEPWKEEDFQKEILKLQLRRETRIPLEAERVWLDRGIADGLIYERKGTETFREIETEAMKTKYEKVFLIESLKTYEKSVVRRESYEEATVLGEKLRETYEKLGYKIERIKPGTIEERLQQILKKIKK
jgi:predicted ATPase